MCWGYSCFLRGEKRLMVGGSYQRQASLQAAALTSYSRPATADQQRAAAWGRWRPLMKPSPGTLMNVILMVTDRQPSAPLSPHQQFSMTTI